MHSRVEESKSPAVIRPEVDQDVKLEDLYAGPAPGSSQAIQARLFANRRVASVPEHPPVMKGVVPI